MPLSARYFLRQGLAVYMGIFHTYETSHLRTSDVARKSNQSRLVIFEPNGHGHRYWYCRLLALGALREGRSVTLLTSTRWLHSAEFNLHLAGPDLAGLRIQLIDEMNGPAFFVHSVDVVRAIRLAATSAAQIIIPEADKALPMLVLWPLPLRRHLAGALVMRAPHGMRGIVKRLLIGAASRRLNVRTLVPSTDDRNGRFVADPVMTTMENTRPFPPSRRLRIGVGGVIDERKCMDGLLALAERGDIDLVLAGRLSEPVRAQVSVLNAGGVGIVAPDRLLEDSELDDLLKTVDVVSVMLATSVGSSGILARAIALGKPVLACGNETVEREVSRLGIGILARTAQPNDVGRALEMLRSRWAGCAAQIAVAQGHLGSAENFYLRLSASCRALESTLSSTDG